MYNFYDVSTYVYITNMYLGVVERYQKSTVCFPRAIQTTRMRIAVLTATIAVRDLISVTVKDV